MSSTRQKGAVLVVALILLLVVTLLGAAVMQGGSLEMKMANNSQERQVAFNAAEEGLRQTEIFLSNNGNITRSSVSTPACSGAYCFNSSCTNGLCFSGTNTVPPGSAGCLVVPTLSAPPALGPWEDPVLNVWNNAAKYRSITVASTPNPVKVIIEFRCWIDDVAGNQFQDALYRITARGKSPSGRVEVMLQSTYRATAPY